MIRATCMLFLSAMFAAPALAGDLTPPGAPAPTMKTLDEVEPRIPIGPLTTPGQFEGTYWISESGSYYLTGNLTGDVDKVGIVVDAPDVTIDLSGFAMFGQPLVASAFPAIYVTANNTNIEVRNGSIVGWSGGGVMFDETQGGLEDVAAIARDLRIRECTGWGIMGERDTMVLNCSITDCLFGGVNLTRTKSQVLDTNASTNGGPGIQTSSEAVVRNCIANVNGGAGIIVGGLSVVTDSVASINLSGSGFDIGEGSVVENCTAAFNSVGFTLRGASTITACMSRNNSQHGFQDTSTAASDNGAVLRACISRENSGAGFLLSGQATMVDCSSVDNIGAGVVAGDGLTIDGGVVEDNNDGGVIAGSGSAVTGARVTNSTGAGVGVDLGADSVLLHSSVLGNALDGVQMGDGGLIQGCVIANNGGHGASVGSRTRVDGSTIRNNLGSGVYANQYCLVTNNIVDNNGDAVGEAGVRAFEGCRIEGNTFSENFRGVRLDDNRNVVVRNTFIRNGSPQLEDVNANNQNALPLTGAATAGPWDNISH